MYLLRILAIVVTGFCLLVPAVHAAQDENASPSPQQTEIQKAYQAAQAVAKSGPAEITLKDQAILKLPAGYAYIPVAEASAVMNALGNQVGSDYLGMVVAEDLSGFVSINYNPAGYIKDDDARDWKADEMLDNLKKGTEAANEDRRKRGIQEFEVTGWIEKPAYEASSHRLVWSAALQDKGAPANATQGVNYNTYLLGREGYMSLNLVTDADSVEREKPLARTLLAAVEFNSGKRYADFNGATDKVAEYGLAALVGGIAVKKLGLLAALGVFLLKAWKISALALVGIGAAVRKFFGGKKKEE
jgi:uncharacterized membrane-anchored protein